MQSSSIRPPALIVSLAVALATLLALAPRLADMEVHPEPRLDLLDDPAGRHIPLPEGRTYAVVEGTGPTTILIHGLAGNTTVWDSLRPGLAAMGRTVAIDLWGRGLTDRPAAPVYDLDAYVAQVEGVRRALGIEQAALVGSSMGGLVAMHYAARYPEHVSALVLLAPAGMPPEQSGLLGVAALPGLGEYLMSVITPLWLKVSYRKMFHNDALADRRFRSRFGLSAEIAGFRRAILETLRHVDLGSGPAALARIAGTDLPVLVVWGNEDEILPVSHLDRFAAALPAARTLRVARAGHLPHIEQPALVGPSVRGFLAELRRPAPAPDPAP